MPLSPVQSMQDPFRETGRHNTPAEGGKRRDISPCATATTPLKEKSCAPPSMGEQIH